MTILLAGNRALFRDERQTEAGPDGSLPHLWCKTGRAMRAQYWPAPHRTASGPALSGLGKVEEILRISGQHGFGESCADTIGDFVNQLGSGSTFLGTTAIDSYRLPMPF